MFGSARWHSAAHDNNPYFNNRCQDLNVDTLCLEVIAGRYRFAHGPTFSESLVSLRAGAVSLFFTRVFAENVKHIRSAPWRLSA